MRSLHLLVPGLFWPDPAEARAYDGLALPALGRLLGKGTAVPAGEHGVEGWLAGLWGHDPARAPVAELLATQAALTGRPGHWLCADPVNLQPRGAELFLTEGGGLDIREHEARDLVEALGRFFSEDGLTFVAWRPDRWLIRSDRPAPIATAPLSAVHGHPIDGLLPAGDQGIVWLRWLNEAQMLMHSHAVNSARESDGRPLINSLWLWGGGSPGTPAPSPFETVYSDDDTVAALASDVEVAPVPESLETPLRAATRGTTLLHLPQVHEAARVADLEAWRKALEVLDENFVAPALGALAAGFVDSIALTGITGRRGVEVRLSRRDTLKFWRRPATLGASLALRGGREGSPAGD
jgi:hypothetical protein